LSQRGRRGGKRRERTGPGDQPNLLENTHACLGRSAANRMIIQKESDATRLRSDGNEGWDVRDRRATENKETSGQVAT
jgi:hypothetical protein